MFTWVKIAQYSSGLWAPWYTCNQQSSFKPHERKYFLFCFVFCFVLIKIWVYSSCYGLQVCGDCNEQIFYVLPVVYQYCSQHQCDTDFDQQKPGISLRYDRMGCKTKYGTHFVLGSFGCLAARIKISCLFFHDISYVVKHMDFLETAYCNTLANILNRLTF